MKKILAACLIAGASVVGLATPAQARTNPTENKTSYWENLTTADDECTKVEFRDGVKEYTPLVGYGEFLSLVVVNAGKVNDVTSWPISATFDHFNGKDISHVIYCVSDDSGGYYGS